jgi:hypothetical protein
MKNWFLDNGAPARQRLKRASQYFVAVILCALILCFLLKLWRAEPRMPLYYLGDSLLHSMFIKGIVENGWYWQNPSLGAPNTLEIIDLATGTAEVVDKGIGRSLHVRHDGLLAYVRKPQGDTWDIRSWTLATRKGAYLVSTLEGSEDLSWTPAGSIVMGNESKPYFWREANDDRWLEVADLRKDGVTAITRVAVSPNGKWIAIVSAPAAPAAK